MKATKKQSTATMDPTHTLSRTRRGRKGKAFEELVRKIAAMVFHWQIAAEDPHLCDELRTFLRSRTIEELLKVDALAQMGRAFQFDPSEFSRRAQDSTRSKAKLVEGLIRDSLKWELKQGLSLADDAGFDLEQEESCENDGQVSLD